MRAPTRIPIVMSRLRQLWETKPDWRLGQLIMNVSETPGPSSLFHLEDDRMLELLEAELETNK